MNILISTVISSIRNIGQPFNLIRILAKHPEFQVPLNQPNNSIAAGSVVHWHELGDSYSSTTGHSRYQRGNLLGWKTTGNRYHSFEVSCPELAKIGQREIVENWTCDICDVYGFFASKSELRNFTSTDQMVETNSPELIDEISHEKLAKNLAHTEIRIIHRPDVDYFALHQWDGRLFLMNDGGSHHFAGAKYIATRLTQSVPLSGKLHTYSLNGEAINSLRRDYEMFVIPKEPTLFMGFSDAMEAYRATWLGHDMPRPFENTKAVLLPKNERRSMRAARALRAGGITDLGAHLSDLVAKQDQSLQPR